MWTDRGVKTYPESKETDSFKQIVYKTVLALMETSDEHTFNEKWVAKMLVILAVLADLCLVFIYMYFT